MALECAGLTGGFYVAWLFEVFVIPATLWGCVGVYYIVRRGTLGVKEANAKSSDDALFVLFCVYPMMSNSEYNNTLGRSIVLPAQPGLCLRLELTERYCPQSSSRC